jgi:putative transcriptional regulator
MANKRMRAELLETARGLYDLDVLDAATLRDFNAAQLPPLKLYGAAEIKRLRLRAKSQSGGFAAYLNTSVSTVQKWEIGDKKPSGPALKLLNMVERKGLKALV